MPPRWGFQEIRLQKHSTTTLPFLIVGIDESLTEAGYRTKIVFTDETNDIALPMQGELAGILVLSVYADRFIEKYARFGKPIVFLDTGIGNSAEYRLGDVVLSEGLHAIANIVKHLAAQGLQKIGFIGDTTYCRTIRERYNGYLLGLKTAGIKPDQTIIARAYDVHHYYEKPGVDAALDAFAYMPEAIVCPSDCIALYLIQCLKERGLRVPEDVAVTGYDNLESLVEPMRPFLTTISIQNYDLGKRLAAQILWRMANVSAPKEIIMLMGDLMIR